MIDYLDDSQRKMLAAYKQGVADEREECIAALQASDEWDMADAIRILHARRSACPEGQP